MGRIFQRLLWEARLIVLVAVVASIVASFAVFFIASVDIFELVTHLGHYAQSYTDAAAHSNLREELIAHVVEAIDGYLLATVLLIFGIGLYEIFIAKIERIERSEIARRVLLVRSLDDLKERLAKVIILILVVKFFQHGMRQALSSAQDLLYFALGILVIALVAFLSHLGQGRSRNSDSM